jgi:hypothetical protein
MIDCRLVTTQDCDDAVRVASLVEEAFGSLEEKGNFVCVLPWEDEELETRIRGRQILDVDFSSIGRAHEYMWKQALTDDEVLGCCLIQWVGNRGWGVLYPYAGREVAVILEGPMIFFQRDASETRIGVWRDAMIAHPMNSSYVGPWPSPSSRSLSENIVENSLSKAIKS